MTMLFIKVLWLKFRNVEKLNIDEDQFFGINKDEGGYYNACCW